MGARERVWKTHRRRAEWTNCPQCGKALRWLYIGDEWYPCDHEPVMFMLHVEGRSDIIYKREIYRNAIIYNRNDDRFKGNIENIKNGYIQHWYTCGVLKRERTEWARNHYGN